MIQLRSHIKKPNCPHCEQPLTLGADEDDRFKFLWECKNRKCRAIFDAKTEVETFSRFPIRDPKFALNWLSMDALT